jgi:hypothetical protein
MLDGQRQAICYKCGETGRATIQREAELREENRVLREGWDAAEDRYTAAIARAHALEDALRIQPQPKIMPLTNDMFGVKIRR